MTILVLIWMVFMIIWEMFDGSRSLNSVLLLLLVNSVSGFRLKLMCISFIVSIRSKPHSFPWFSAACPLPWFIEITFLNCTSRIILLYLKQSSDRLVIIAKGFWKLPNLHILLKQKDFGKFLIVFSTKINLPYLLYSTGRRH